MGQRYVHHLLTDVDDKIHDATTVQMLTSAVPDKLKPGALMATWLSAHSKWILAGVVPKLFQIAFMFSQPLLVETAIAFAATPDETEFNNLGYGLIGAYTIIYVGIAVCLISSRNHE